MNFNHIRDQVEKDLIEKELIRLSCERCDECRPCSTCPHAAWPQGAYYGDGPVRVSPSTPRRDWGVFAGRDGISEIGLNSPIIDSIIERDPGRWPLFSRSRKSVRPAFSTKVEWIIDSLERCSMGHMHNAMKAEFNYTQIFRTMFTNAQRATRLYVGDDQGELFVLEGLLDQIEHTIRDGRRHLDVSSHMTVQMMGGAFQLLGRWPRKDDHLELVVLRDLIRCSPADMDGVEWLVEFTLKATKGSK